MDIGGDCWAVGNMAPRWNRDDTAFSLLGNIISISVMYALSVGILIIISRLLVILARKHAAITNEATFKGWIACSLTLAVGHLTAIVTLYDSQSPLSLVLLWSLIATLGLTIGLGLAGGVIAIAVVICYKYL